MPTGTRELTLRFLAAPTDAGYSGNVSGGRVLEWIDKAGYAAAVGWAGRYCVTAYVGNVRFTRPVEVGDLVEATGRLVHAGRSSMHVLVSVSSGNPREGHLTEATECLMIFVAVDEDGRPTPVPAYTPETDEERRWQEAAVARIALRADIEAAMGAQTYSEDGTAPRTVLRFLAAPTDVNWGGKVHGGIVMRWIDEAAHVLATSWTGSANNVAVYSGGVRFYRPLRIGHLVEVEARLLLTGDSSMHISVHVRSGDPATGDLELTTHSLIVFVPLDESGRAVTARPWVPSSAEDVALRDHALELVEMRNRVDAERHIP
ncbi:acyl-CoA thioesterase [Terracoccus luteus]|uniref:4-hydroxybenzoyl-CoA thioesterase n=1 Tax=Terracoccus luteus TaxID=53356 RepID=A0A839PYZ0_9MICO|nr:hotdog domain-containing protein [Terracoccus luteus]MBB2986002.1 4-hydroxybenzoyl-CoA thioesterase [Terracoccus luteus]MCP2171654.1 4-hydroxybenzoyl-CoA thioesterase [Terracoccus luteus]